MMRDANILSLTLALASALSPVNFAFGADAPLYKDGVLTLPTVNTPEQVGKYQDVTFNLTEQGLWQLSSLKAIGTVTGNSGLGLAPIVNVDVVKTNTFPVQVLLRVSGSFGDGCPHLGQINQRLESNRFDVAVTSQYVLGTPCPAIQTPFLETIPLAVYGLSAGSYSYDVNGIKGTFELTADNRLISVGVTPAANDQGKQANIYVAAVSPGGQVYFMSDSYTWTPFTSCETAPSYSSGYLKAFLGIVVPSPPADLPSLKGAYIYTGYGVGDATSAKGDFCRNMLNNGTFSKSNSIF